MYDSSVASLSQGTQHIPTTMYKSHRLWPKMWVTLATSVLNSNWNLAWSGSVSPECVCVICYTKVQLRSLYMCLRGAEVKSRVQVLLTQCWTNAECSPFFHPDPTGPRGSPSPSCQSSTLRRAQWHGPLMKQETGPPGKRAGGTQQRPQKTTESLGLSGKGACYHIYMHDSFWRLLYASGYAKY